jgi:hypothetical protein
MLDFWTMSTVVPTGGKLTSVLLLGLDSAATSLLAEAEALALADDEAAPAVADAGEDPEADADEAALWIEVLGAAVAFAAVLELDDPPHAASASTSEPSPPAAAHRLLRITCFSLTGNLVTGPAMTCRAVSSRP